MARTGSRWRDLPEAYGNWFTVHIRFWRWTEPGVWGRISCRPVMAALRNEACWANCPHRRCACASRRA
ncbi:MULTISPECIES: transposase [unclassified Bradyrhizobium]